MVKRVVDSEPGFLACESMLRKKNLLPSPLEDNMDSAHQLCSTVIYVVDDVPYRMYLTVLYYVVAAKDILKDFLSCWRHPPPRLLKAMLCVGTL